MGDSTFEKLLVALNPSKYGNVEADKIKELKSIVKEEGLIKGMIEIGKKKIELVPKPIATHKLTFQSDQAQLEPIFYWILDFMQEAEWKVKKIVDNFIASPGSGQFSEMSGKATKNQEEAMKMLGAVNQVVKAALNLIYDLKEFEQRLSLYEKFASKDEKEVEDARLTLKQIWLDNVDIRKGNGAIHQMATSQMGFVTIREIFMKAKDTRDVDKMAEEGLMNESIKRTVLPRIEEFLQWVKYSGEELKKRYSIEKSYLKSQVETIKMYSSWLKPYIKAAEELKQKGFPENAALVNAFSTSMFQLTLLGKKTEKDLGNFEKGASEKQKKALRKYHPLMMIDIKFRGHVAQRATQKGDYAFAYGGKLDMTFDAYVVNNEELKLVEDELAKEEVLDSMKFSMNLAEDSLKALNDDLEKLLKTEEEREKDKAEKDKKNKKETGAEIDFFGAIKDTFLGIFKGPFASKEKKKDIKEIKLPSDIKPDNYIEQEIRINAEKTASEGLYLIYDIYKKSHGMASSPESFSNTKV